MTLSAMNVLNAAQQLQQRGQACALVTVLRVQPPASARPGDKAVVNAQGFVSGWIGGGCAQPAVLRTVREALADGRSRLIRIAPSETGEVRELADVLEFGMACHSGGTLELFIDPLLPPARLVVVGDSPVAQALSALAPQVGLQVQVVAHGAEAGRFGAAAQVLDDDDPQRLSDAIAPGAFVVVATQGRRDVQGLRAALALGARQVGFVASARKAAVLKASLVEAGADPDAVQAIVAPFGQAIGAQTPEEIALSVLAAVVSARRGGGPTVALADAAEQPAATRSAALPAAAPSTGSCCGGGAGRVASAAAQTEPPAPAVTPMAEMAQPAPQAVAQAAPARKGSCCGG